MTAYNSPFRPADEDDDVIIPDKHDPKEVMSILLVEVRALTEAFKEFKEDRKQVFRDHQKECNRNMSEVYGRLRVIEDKAAACDALKKQSDQDAKAAPHWVIAKGTYWLVLVTGMLFMDVALNVYRFFSGGGH